MSEDKKRDRVTVAKIKNLQSKSGETFQKIYIDNLNPNNDDGTPNKYYRGALVWYDINGNAYQIKQMSISVPKNGMPQGLAKNGFVCYVNIDLEDQYDVTILPNK